MEFRPPTRFAPDPKGDSIPLRGRSWPMQTLLAFLVLAATLPLGALLFWNEGEQARAEEATATERVLQLAQNAAAQTDEFLADTLQLLERLARRPTMRAMDPAACDPAFTGFGSQFPRYANLVLVDANGGGVCASSVLVPGANTYAHFPSIRAIADGAQQSIEPPTFGPKTQRWISAATVAVRDEAGQRLGTLTITLDLQRFPLPPLHRQAPSAPRP